MRISSFLLLFLSLIITSCSNNTSDVPQPPSEWVVIGNDLGFRNEFIDMANVVRLSDSSLTVYSVAYPDVALKFPIRDSVVIGSPDKKWQLTTAGPDSLLLHDTVQDNRYHLLRLKDYTPQENVWKVLSGSRFSGHSYIDDKTFAFEGKDPTEPNCYVSHRTRIWEGQRRPMRQKDGFWRLDQRFSQPILLYTQGQSDHYVTLIDSVDSQAGIQGQLLINSRPNPLVMQRDTLRPIRDTMNMEVLGQRIAQMDFSEVEVKPMIDPAIDNRWRVSWDGSELEEVLSTNDFEVTDLRLFLQGGTYSITSAENELAAGKFELHPVYPYLILESSCANDFYLPLATTENELKITMPLRIRLTDKKINQNDLGPDRPNRAAYSENAVVFTIPYFTESTK